MEFSGRDLPVLLWLCSCAFCSSWTEIKQVKLFQPEQWGKCNFFHFDGSIHMKCTLGFHVSLLSFKREWQTMVGLQLHFWFGGQEETMVRWFCCVKTGKLLVCHAPIPTPRKRRLRTQEERHDGARGKLESASLN